MGAVGCGTDGSQARGISMAHDFDFPPASAAPHLPSSIHPGPRYLRLGEHQCCGHLKALGSGQVLVELELVFELQELLAGEGCAGPTALPHQARLRGGCGADSGWGSGDSGAAGNIPSASPR